MLYGVPAGSVILNVTTGVSPGAVGRGGDIVSQPLEVVAEPLAGHGHGHRSLADLPGALKPPGGLKSRLRCQIGLCLRGRVRGCGKAYPGDPLISLASRPPPRQFFCFLDQ